MDKNSLKVFCDGGARGNPGPGASSFIIFRDGKELVRYSKFLGKTTNNLAEYYGVLFAMKWISQKKEQFKDISIYFNLDSQLVVRQLTGEYKIKEEKLKVITSKIKLLQDELDNIIYFNHIPREKNKLADLLVNETIDENT